MPIPTVHQLHGGLLYPQEQQYLPQEGWTREESSRREVRGSPVQGRGTSRTVNWKFIPYSVRDHVYFRGNTCVLGAPPSCGPAPGSEVWMVPRDPELHRVTGGKERSHSSGPGEGPSLLRGDPYFFCWLVPHGVTGGWCPEILSSTKGQVGETEVAAQDVEQFQHFQEKTEKGFLWDLFLEGLLWDPLPWGLADFHYSVPDDDLSQTPMFREPYTNLLLGRSFWRPRGG
nr:uncharacterized protein LOC111752811 isoform X4 [Loxodonta africana]